jgi:hypothetical protein
MWPNETRGIGESRPVQSSVLDFEHEGKLDTYHVLESLTLHDNATLCIADHDMSAVLGAMI